MGDGDGEREGEVRETRFPLQGRVDCPVKASCGAVGDGCPSKGANDCVDG